MSSKADIQATLDLRTRLLKDMNEHLVQALERAETAEEALEKALATGRVDSDPSFDPLTFGHRLTQRLASMTHERDYYRNKCANYKERVDELQHEVAYYRRILRPAIKAGMRLFSR